MKLKKLIPILIFGCITTVFAGNEFQFNYDAAGNRVQRMVIVVEEQVLRSAKVPKGQTEKPADKVGDENYTVKVFPNPTTGLVLVEIDNLPENERNSVILLDASGRKIESREHLQASNLFDFTNAANGVYMLRLHIGKQQRVWKIIKK